MEVQRDEFGLTIACTSPGQVPRSGHVDESARHRDALTRATGPASHKHTCCFPRATSVAGTSLSGAVRSRGCRVVCHVQVSSGVMW